MADIEELGRLHVGKVVAMKSFKATFGDKTNGELELSFRKPSGKRYVFVLLGLEDDKGEAPVDVDEVLRSMGWELKKEE